MDDDIWMIIVVAYLIIDVVMASKMSKAALMKGHNSVFALCFFLGPAAYLYVIALPDLELRNAIKAMQTNGNANNVPQSSGNTGSMLSRRAAEATVIKSADGKWRCPTCGESNPTSTRICRGCGREK